MNEMAFPMSKTSAPVQFLIFGNSTLSLSNNALLNLIHALKSNICFVWSWEFTTLMQGGFGLCLFSIELG